MRHIPVPDIDEDKRSVGIVDRVTDRNLLRDLTYQSRGE